jgi:hypothetical protein
MAREGVTGPVIYVGHAGERFGGRDRPQGIRGRLSIYLTGKGLASGLGEAVFDRALGDAVFLRERLNEVDRVEPLRAKEWGKRAFACGDLHIRWLVSVDKASAAAIESECLRLLGDAELWNRDADHGVGR